MICAISVWRKIEDSFKNNIIPKNDKSESCRPTSKTLTGLKIKNSRTIKDIPGNIFIFFWNILPIKAKTVKTAALKIELEKSTIAE